MSEQAQVGDTEEWRPIPIVPRYEASNLGRIRHIKSGHILSPAINSHGYRNFFYRNSGSIKGLRVHRAVAMAFLGERNQLVRHLDDDKLNNALSNLAYGTQSENMADAVANGRSRAASAACKYGHDFTPENTYVRIRRNPSGETGTVRNCRACKKRRNSEARERANV